MSRMIFSALAALSFTLSAAAADEVKGVVKAVNGPDSIITLTIDTKDVIYHVAFTVDIKVDGVKELKGLKPGTKVVVTLIQGNVCGKDQKVVRVIKEDK